MLVRLVSYAPHVFFLVSTDESKYPESGNPRFQILSAFFIAEIRQIILLYCGLPSVPCSALLSSSDPFFFSV
jgi:hypothetical protein